jgi:hypothetical protein
MHSLVQSLTSKLMPQGCGLILRDERFFLGKTEKANCLSHVLLQTIL